MSCCHTVFRFRAGVITIAAVLALISWTEMRAGTALVRELPWFERTLETDTAIIHFHPQDEPIAHQVASSLDYAQGSVGEILGRIPGKITTYVYRSNSEMAGGLRQVLGYEQWEIDAILRVGISACTRRTLHIHRRLTAREPSLWHAVVDEYVQGVIEERFGPGPAHTATWLEEGVSSFIAHEALAERLSQYERWFLIWSHEVAFNALTSGQLPRLADISTRRQWYLNIARGGAAWINQYAAAHVAVTYLTDKYGLHSIRAVLAAICAGLELNKAMEEVLGVSLHQFQEEFLTFLETSVTSR